MLYDLVSARDNIRNRDGRRVFYLGSGDQLTSQARDWLQSERIEILPASRARPERWRLLGGGYLEEKPEHITHLYGDVLVEKTHPRIGFRGAIDTLEAEILLCGKTLTRLQPELTEILTLARDLIRYEVMNEPVAQGRLLGLTEQQLREQSHRPQDFFGKPHFMPDFGDNEQVLYLNRVRCAVRNAERMAVAAVPERTDILRALNRMSSAIYILMVKEK